MNHAKPTIRPIGIIKNHIKTLQAELAEAQKAEKANTAVYVLENLGWSWCAETASWAKPKDTISATVKARYHSDKGPIREGDLATWDNKVLGGNVLVRTLIPGSTKALVSWVSNVTLRGFTTGMATFTVEVSDLTARPRQWFIGK